MNIKLDSSIEDQILKHYHYFTYSYELAGKTLKKLFSLVPSNGDRFYWCTPDEKFELLGVGENLFDEKYESKPSSINEFSLEFSKSFLNVSDRNDAPLLFGGFPFDRTNQKEKIWGKLESGFFILPSILFKRIDSRIQVILTIRKKDATTKSLLKDFECLDSIVHALLQGEEQEQSANVLVSSEELAVPAFLHNVDDARKEITLEATSLKKVVLSRQLAIHGSFRSTTQILQRLAEQQPETYLFLLASDQHAFIGATPERLIQGTKSQFMTAGIAGSAPRGSTMQEDQEIGEELLKDYKNTQEHGIVAQRLEDQLADIVAGDVAVSSRRLLKNRDIQHLAMTFSGERQQGVSLIDAVELIHPSPALGGEPKELALQWIKEHEPFGRGLYGAPIGWLDPIEDVGEFAVGIRSGILTETEGILYAGCGIVADSDPETERQETLLKFQPMLRGVRG
ncbi:Menaquinone-specific isochorismate synthase [Enterococcus mundtii 3F]|uniref:isochorismate synthase n=1 Tax=Enterococcus mundtii TaxID=53346 RepID=UPI002304BFB2|nr:isochorismate synthase [Enterococcus mundtii]MDA9461956.1 Menaquinone-specific isochorismate synthase [Enterococcus mundtii 3F]